MLQWSYEIKSFQKRYHWKIKISNYWWKSIHLLHWPHRNYKLLGRGNDLVEDTWKRFVSHPKGFLLQQPKCQWLISNGCLTVVSKVSVYWLFRRRWNGTALRPVTPGYLGISNPTFMSRRKRWLNQSSASRQRDNGFEDLVQHVFEGSKANDPC